MLAFDMRGQADLFADDGVSEAPFAPAGVANRFEGREAIRTMLLRAGERAREMGIRPQGWSYVQVHETTDPEVVIVEFVGRIQEPSGATREVPYVEVYRVHNGEIALFRDYYTPQTAAVKLE